LSAFKVVSIFAVNMKRFILQKSESLCT